ncbi:serine/threonine protein kinase [Anabaena sp. CCY 9402-a]|uniref:serine/threonine protein kinase n=1 Tax=Anabaena sp. CCY 9402-a TaxID=3103867 RepID=UPI0039C74149
MPWIAGQQLQGGKYVIEKVLGQGGFGITYKALQVELNRPVVIKIPNEFLSHDPEYEKYVERFIKEGRILARLSQDPHPHIVAVIDLFQEGNTHCLVMEFVEGENLFEAVKRRGALPESEIVPCICQIAEALTVVHQAGLVHRDAHPGNIMLGKDGNAVLIDFGIAKGIEPQTLTSTGNAGNRGFAPYEQIIRGSREPTVDIYCLAATLYYAATGQPPTNSLSRVVTGQSPTNSLSRGTNFLSLRVERVIKEDPLIPPKQINPDISKRLNQAIVYGMALEAKDRPQSMQAWLVMLKATIATARELGRITLIEWLIGVLFNNLFIGYFLAASNYSYIVWIVVVAMLWTLAMAAAGVGDVVMVEAAAAYHLETARVNYETGYILRVQVFAGLLAVTGAWAVTKAVTAAWFVVAIIAGFFTIGMAWLVGGGVIVAGSILQDSFSKAITFLILLSISNIGLGLGWQLGRMIHAP